MIDKIVERINDYCSSIDKPVNCVRFGKGKMPKPPYVVVKQEIDSGGRGAAFRIISHFEPSQEGFLSKFNRGTIGEALDGFKATSSDGNYNMLQKDRDSYDGTVSPNDDGTISTERLYYMGDYI